MRELVLLVFLLSSAGCGSLESREIDGRLMPIVGKATDTATFAGGCFWCMDAAFEKIDGVEKVISGFAGGDVVNPTYEDVSAGSTGHRESIQVVYDPRIVSYTELVDIFWRQFDPTDAEGSFVDRGSQYRSAIFYHDEGQKKIAETSKTMLERSAIFDKPVVTEIIQFTAFYPAEEYHQQFCKKNPIRYYSYKNASGREEFIKSIWGDLEMEKYKKPSIEELKKKLSGLQYDVSQKSATERPFANDYWDNHKEGIYVEIASGEPLFSSRDKFDSGTGWPSFTKPIDPRYIVKKSDSMLGMERIEVRSKIGDSHLGHVFDDGPAPTNLRYCMNSASMKFIPKENMEKEGYGEFLWLFK